MSYAVSSTLCYDGSKQIAWLRRARRATSGGKTTMPYTTPRSLTLRSRFALAMASAAVLCLGAGCSGSARQSPAPQEWRFAIEEPRGSVQYAYAAEFKRRIEAKSEGAVSVAIYPYGTLGT